MQGSRRAVVTAGVGRHDRAEQDGSAKPSGDRVDVSHGTRIEHGACELHREGSGGSDGMGGDVVIN